ncbi:hypothetical protein NDU88_005927 [Pleurodeles waltl]|uniref:Uncharacterized protein n=1 Tax=Pleurodeles waltl TaxID=8319 RepID=A0AAV7ULC7_PLEWA|nr:hypothetical protein NDU88_005927 [Pleurodeles waltl]
MDAPSVTRAPAPDLHRASRPGRTSPRGHSSLLGHRRRSASSLSGPGSQHGRARGPPRPSVSDADPELPGPRTRPLRPLSPRAHIEPPMPPPVPGITAGHNRAAGPASTNKIKGPGGGARTNASADAAILATPPDFCIKALQTAVPLP